MGLLARVRVDRGAAPGLGPGEIAGVVEMAVGDEDRLDGVGRKAEPRQPAADLPWLADQPGVEQHGVARVVHQQVADAHDAADRVDA
jgi:hypothetical protein